jgi:AcrR family transcriptional regulator
LTPRAPDGRVPFTRPRKVRYSKLKPGPSQSAEEVRADQRARLHSATIELVADRGYSGLTVRGISRTAGVSTRTLYAHFENVEECFASTYRWINRRAVEQLPDAMEVSKDWESGVHEWIRTLTASVAANPHAARLVLVDAYDGGPAMLREIEAATSNLERQLAIGPISMTLSQAILAGVERLVRSRLLEDRATELPRLANELADWVLGVCELESAEASAPTAGSAEQRPLPPTTGRKDPAFAAFEAVGGDRGRILSAVARRSATKGYWNLTTTDLRREAGVSRRTFDALFDDIGSCYAEAGRALLTAAARTAIKEADEALSWPIRIEQIVNRLCAEVIRSPLLAQLGFIDVFNPGSAGLLGRERLLMRSTAWMRAWVPAQWRPGELAAEASMAASWRVVQVQITASGNGSQMDAAPSLITRLIRYTPIPQPRADRRAYPSGSSP